MRVSIIIPYKTDRGWLKEAIESIPGDVELILSQGEGPWPMQFNAGLNRATGDLIKWLHDDDLIVQDSIETCVEYFKKHPEVDFIHGRALEFFVGQRPSQMYIPLLTKPTLEDLVKNNVFHSTTMMYRRRVFDVIGKMNESWDMYSFEEYEYNLRCLKGGMKVGYVDDIIGMYRRHSTQIIRTVDRWKRRENRNKLLSLYS